MSCSLLLTYLLRCDTAELCFVVLCYTLQCFFILGLSVYLLFANKFFTTKSIKFLRQEMKSHSNDDDDNDDESLTVAVMMM